MASIVKAVDGRGVIAFEGLNAPGGGFGPSSKWSYRVLGKRCPNKGEYFLSGAIPEAYKAKQHLTQEYVIVIPVSEYKLRQVWVRKALLNEDGTVKD